MSKKDVCDDQIKPLMDRVFEICKANKIAMLSYFTIDDGWCVSCCLANPDCEPDELLVEMAEVVAGMIAVSEAENN